MHRLLNFMEQQGELIVERLGWIYMYYLFNETCAHCYFGLVNTWLHVWVRVCVLLDSTPEGRSVDNTSFDKDSSRPSTPKGNVIIAPRAAAGATKTKHVLHTVKPKTQQQPQLVYPSNIVVLPEACQFATVNSSNTPTTVTTVTTVSHTPPAAAASQSRGVSPVMVTSSAPAAAVVLNDSSSSSGGGGGGSAGGGVVVQPSPTTMIVVQQPDGSLVLKPASSGKL